MNLQKKKINIKGWLVSAKKKQMMGVYIPSPNRLLILDRASHNLNMNVKLKYKPTRSDLVAEFGQKKLNPPMPTEAAWSRLGHPARYDCHHFRSCPLAQITLRKDGFGNVQDLRGIIFSVSLTDSISYSATGKWWAPAKSLTSC